MTAFEPFFGREIEIREVREALLTDDSSVVTITGIGGIGKTSLAARVMKDLEQYFSGGAFFLSLSELEHSGQLVPHILSSLGREPVLTGAELRLTDTLSRSRILLVLDNFEHIISARRIIEALSTRINCSRILITSRTRLDFHGEQVYKLGGFAAPDGKDIRNSASIRLFSASSGKSEPYSPDELEMVAEICRKLEGVPLGIKLASSLTVQKSLSEILDIVSSGKSILDVRSREGERRHRNLRAVFTYSWQFLSIEEKKAFACLSIFRGGFLPGAAMEVTGTEHVTLKNLWSKSLLEKTGEGIYTFHPLLRGYSLSKFQETGNTEIIRDNHAAYFCNILKEHLPAITTRDSASSIDVLTSCHSDIMTAINRAFVTGMTVALGESLRTLRVYLMRRGLLATGREIFERAVEFFEGTRSQDYFECLVDLGSFLLEMTLYEKALLYLEKATETPVPRIRSKAVYSMGIVFMRTGDLKRAEENMVSSLEMARASESEPHIASALAGLGDFYNHSHDSVKAEYFMKQAVEINRRTDNAMNLLSNLITLSNLMYNNDRGIEAIEYANESLALAEILNGDLFVGLAEVSVASALEILGKLPEALKHAIRSVNLFEMIDSRWGMQTSYSTLTSIQSKLGMESESLKSADILEKLCLEMDGTYNSMEYLITVGETWEKAGNKEKALEIFRKSEKTAEKLKLDLYLNKLRIKIANLS